MRSPLGLALAAVFAVPIPGRTECSYKAAAPDSFAAHCSNAAQITVCADHVSATMRDCDRDADKAFAVIQEYEKLKPPIDPAVKLKASAARFRIVEILNIQSEFSRNARAGAVDPSDPSSKPKYPALNIAALNNLYNEQFKDLNANIVALSPPSPAGTDLPLDALRRSNPSPLAGKAVAGMTAAGTTTAGLQVAAAEHLEKAEPPTPEAGRRNKLAAGDLYLAAGDTAGAERVGTDLTKLAPGDAAGPALLARAALSREKPAEAAEWARKALALDPKNTEARQALSYAESSLSKSRLKGPAAKPDFGLEAQADGTAAPGLARTGSAPPSSPAGAVAPPLEALAAPPHLKLAYRKAAIGDYPGALADLTLALDQNEGDDDARVLRAEVSLALENPAAALADADRVLTKRPDDPRALRAKSSALLQLGRLEEALAMIERALALDPLAAAGHLTRAMILEKLGRGPDAAASFREAARLDPALTPVSEAALRRLGHGPASAADAPTRRKLLRGGLIAGSLLLVLAGLAGGARMVTRRARAAAALPDEGPERTVGRGDTIGGQYTIMRELGRGGMGVVFEALDETLKRSVALKQMQADFRASPEDAARFLQEARLVAQLKHPNIAEIYAAVDDGGLFLVFELIEGQPLDRSVAGGGIDPAAARRIVADLCAGLAAAHARRIIHRDLKPSNVMLASDGRSKIMDFGIAHQARGAAATQTAMSGTPPYMAPEQAMGTVLPASDLYALGVMTYELLSGTRPFLGPDFFGPKMRGEFNPVTRLRPGLPPSLDAFFSAALSPDPARRPIDAASFHKSFDACWS